jgi:hypothetical protein
MDTKDMFPEALAAAQQEFAAAHPYEPPTFEEMYDPDKTSVDTEAEPFDEEDDLHTDVENMAARDEDARGYWCTLDEAAVIEEDMYHYARAAK